MTRQALTADNPAPMMELANRFAEAKSLLTAEEVGLFAMLATGPASTAEIVAKLNLHERPTPDLLHLLVALGVLEKVGPDRFANTAAAQRYLVPTSPDYMGSLLKNRTNVLYPGWGGFTEAVSANYNHGVDGSTADNFIKVLNDPGRLQHMINMIENLHGALGPLLTQAIDWSPFRSVVDLGGAHGLHLVPLVRAYPHLAVGVFELSPLGPKVEECAAAAGMPGRIAFYPGDFFVDPFPPSSAFIYGHVLHNFAPSSRQFMVTKAYEALEPGGALLVFDRMIDEDRRDVAKLLESLSMWVASKGGGSEYLPSDCQGYMTTAGFSRTTVQFLTPSEVLVIGYKERG